MKGKLYLIAFAILVGTIVFAATNNFYLFNGVDPIEVNISSSSVIDASNKAIYLTPDQTYQLVARVVPENASTSLTWTSSDPSKVSVDDQGLVTALANESNVTITVETTNGKKDTINVLVNSAYVWATGLNFASANVNLEPGANTTVCFTVEPANALDILSLSSTNSNVAQAEDVSGAIKIYGLNSGKSEIIAKTINGIQGKISVVVNGITFENLGTQVDNDDNVLLTMQKNTTKQVDGTVFPTNTITWSSNNEDIATVDGNGVISALETGSCIITASAGSYSKTIALTVVDTEIPNIEDYFVDSLTLYQDATYNFSSPLELGSAYSSDSSIVKVVLDSNMKTGTLKAINPGTATVYYDSIYGLAKTEVTVVEGGVVSATSLELATDERVSKPNDDYLLTLNVNSSYGLQAVVLPENSFDKSVTWSSDNDSIAKVTTSGVVSGISSGETYVTASSNGFTVKCKVIVSDSNPTSISLDKTSITLSVNDSELIIPSIEPNSANPYVHFTSSNTGVINFNWSSEDLETTTAEDIYVVGCEAGTTTITATTINGKSATCEVTVLDTKPTNMILDKENVTIKTGSTDVLTPVFTPAETSDKSVTWKTSNFHCVTVSDGGVITGIERGQATITCISNANPSLSATCVITVLQDVTSIELDTQDVNINVNEAYYLNATILPTNADDRSVTWTTDNSDVISLSSSGRVYGKQPGTATVKVTSVSNPNISATCNVTVSKIEVTDIELLPATAKMLIGGQLTLTANVLPNNATDKTIQWKSEDTSIATVNNGIVTAKKHSGNKPVAIKATTSNGKSATCLVTVYDVPEKGITLDKHELTMYTNTNYLFKVTFDPENTTDKTLTWTSSDTSVVAANGGFIRAIKPGTATITAKSKYDYEDTCEITVIPVEVTGIELPAKATTFVGKHISLSATITPSNATDKTITWSSEDKSIATVNNGCVTGRKHSGNKPVKITATTSNGMSATCLVTVYDIAEKSITLDKHELTMYVNTNYLFKVTFDPENTTDKTLKWTSTDDSIVAANGGYIRAFKPGTATITVESKYAKTDSCVVTVLPIIETGFELDKHEANLEAGSGMKLNGIFTPADTTDKTITWSSSDPTIATVGSNGWVKAIKGGIVTITGTSPQGLSDTCEITVGEIPTSITLDPTSLNVNIGEDATIVATVFPSTATDKSVTWSSDNESVATVDNGLVHGVAEGTVNITCKSVANPNVSAICEVTVNSIIPTNLELNKHELELQTGDIYKQLTWQFTPANTTDQTITWSSTDKGVAKFVNGSLYALSAGEATIRATSNADSNVYDEVVVTVSDVLPTDLQFNETTLNLTTGSYYDGLQLIWTPSNTTNKNVIWDTGNDDIAMYIDGRIVAIGEGTTTISATSQVDPTLCAVVTVNVSNINPLSITFNKLSLNMKVGEENSSLTVTFNPTNVTVKDILWSSDNEAVATVVNGVITAVGVGNCNITATSLADTSKTATCNLTVTVP